MWRVFLLELNPTLQSIDVLPDQETRFVIVSRR